MPNNNETTKPPLVPPVKDKKEKRKPASSPFIIENPGKVGAEIFDEIVRKLDEGGHQMVITHAKMIIKTRALIVDEHLLKDDEEHEAEVTFEVELQRDERVSPNKP